MWTRNAFTIMAMVDYPYPASFLGTLPAWPVHYSCQLLANETSQGVDILTAFKDLAGILYNDTSDCFDIYAQFIECADPTSCGLGNDAKAWDYQVTMTTTPSWATAPMKFASNRSAFCEKACTELNTVQESNGVADMFPVLPYNEQMREDYRMKTWNVKTRGQAQQAQINRFHSIQPSDPSQSAFKYLTYSPGNLKKNKKLRSILHCIQKVLANEIFHF